MATNQATENVEYDTMTNFDRVAAQIEETFNQLIEQLIGRKEALLRKVLQLQEDFHNKESTRREAIQELEKTQEQLRHMSVKANLNIPIHQQASQVYEQGMKELATPVQLPPLSFSCPTRDRLVKLIIAFGNVSAGIPNLDKKEPILTAGKAGKGDGEFDGPTGLALDEANMNIYLVDMFNRRIQIFSFQGEFIQMFGEDVLEKPWGIAITDDHIFITDLSLHSLLLYDKKTFRLFRRVGSKGSEEGYLNCPHGLAVDTNGDVFIADSFNQRISVFSNLFPFHSCIGQGKLYYPQDVKLTTESVVVLDWNYTCVHFFTRNGDLLSSCVTQGNKQECLVCSLLSFCLDKDSNNIIISDYHNNTIKIVSSSGELSHTIGCQGMGRGEFILPHGIAMSVAGVIFVVSHNMNFTLQAF